MCSTRSPARKGQATRALPGPGAADADLVVVAHGSSRAPVGATTTAAHVERLRRRNLFRTVHAGFLFGTPSIEDALARVSGPSVHIVPFLMSDGDYTRNVVPERLGLSEPHATNLRYGRPVGTHPGLAAIVSRRAGELCRSASVPLTEATLILVGHGSPRDRASATATLSCARQIRTEAPFGGVRVAFLDERPSLIDTLSEVRDAHLVVAGFFADEGRHAGEDVRAALGLTRGQSELRRPNGNLLAYTGAIGADPAMADIIMARALERDRNLTETGEPLKRSA